MAPGHPMAQLTITSDVIIWGGAGPHKIRGRGGRHVHNIFWEGPSLVSRLGRAPAATCDITCNNFINQTADEC